MQESLAQEWGIQILLSIPLNIEIKYLGMTIDSKLT
jgi:hypothetical protein